MERSGIPSKQTRAQIYERQNIPGIYKNDVANKQKHLASKKSTTARGNPRGPPQETKRQTKRPNNKTL